MEKRNNRFSNLIPGFSSRNPGIPLDLLIVGEAHGGGRSEDFHSQWSLREEVEYIANYYLQDRIVKFHQSEMRQLFDWLGKQGIEYVFTDLIKCYVWRKNRENLNLAIDKCGKYLLEQFEILQPKIVLALGNTVQEYVNRNMVPVKQNYQHVIPSLFPSQFTADRWVENKRWANVKNRIADLMC